MVVDLAEVEQSSAGVGMNFEPDDETDSPPADDASLGEDEPEEIDSS
jgi:hypothetical protein